MPRHLLSIPSGIAAALSLLLASGPARATQPLETFLAAARESSFEVRQQRAAAEQRSWERQAALGRLLPSVSARGVYTHNQYEVGIRNPSNGTMLTITPQNQLDALFELDVPLVDFASYARFAQAKHLARAAATQIELSQSDVEQAVARAYYGFIGAAALAEAAVRSQKNAEANLAYVSARFDAGAATELDRERARANVERSKQDLTDAELARMMAARNLETLSGITPTAVSEYPADDLRAEAPLASWMASRDTPSDRLQAELGRAADSAKRAASSALLPTLSASAQERVSNATGFSGHASSYLLQAVLSWRLDYATYSTAEAQASAQRVQSVQSERARRGVEDQIFEAYQRVESGIVKSASARAQADAAAHAERLAVARYQAGALTQLDVTQAERDAYQAQAARIQADADLAYARILLRLVAGKPPRVPPSTTPPTPAAELAPAPAAAAPGSAVPATPAPATNTPTPPSSQH